MAELVPPNVRGESEFEVGVDDFADLEIREARLGDRFFYFYHTKRRALIKQFVLGRTKRTKRICLVSLIRNEHGRFEPRFEFSTRDTSSSVIESVDEPVRNGETRTIKARVDLKDCHENLWRLIGYLEGVEGIELPASRFHLVPESQADLAKALQGAPRAEAIAAVKASLQGITEEEIALLSGRKASLTEFEVLLHDEGRFEAARRGLGDNKRAEDVWQDFFERNQWIFGYGLKLVSCEGLGTEKLQTIITGASFASGAGKSMDALMRTRGEISSLLFCEIKTPDARLMMASYYRAEVFVPDTHLRGGVAQVQKAIHKLSLNVSENYKVLTIGGGSPTGEIVATVRPRGVVVIGRLAEFVEEHGTNYERLASFELYRNTLAGLEIITFDELLARARFIVEVYT